MDRPAIITFLSDFGTREHYVGAVKGSILTIRPEARIIDISHEVEAHDVTEGAFTLFCSYSCFPPESIHLCVVDPGVGSSRRGLIVQTTDRLFVAPDNGLLALVLQAEKIDRIVSIEAERYFRHPVSATFHARDVFGPVAAWLSRGEDVSSFGPEVSAYEPLALPRIQIRREGILEGVILHIDRFGNLITNLRADEAKKHFGENCRPAAIEVAGTEIARFVGTYSEDAGNGPFALLGSSGFYEIAARNSSSARLLKVNRGARVRLTFAAFRAKD